MPCPQSSSSGKVRRTPQTNRVPGGGLQEWPPLPQGAVSGRAATAPNVWSLLQDRPTAAILSSGDPKLCLVPQHLGPPLTTVSGHPIHPVSRCLAALVVGMCTAKTKTTSCKGVATIPTSQSLLGLSSAVLAVWPVVPAVPLYRLAGGYMSSEAAASGPSVVSGASCFPSV